MAFFKYCEFHYTIKNYFGLQRFVVRSVMYIWPKLNKNSLIKQ